MLLFHLDWFVCEDGYRLEEWPASRRVRRSGENRLVIVPNSEAWLPSKPLNSPGLHRHLCGCDLGGPEELLGFIQTNGLLFRAKGPKEPWADVVEYVLSMRHLLTAIDGCDWRSIAEGLRRPGEGAFSDPRYRSPGRAVRGFRRQSITKPETAASEPRRRSAGAGARRCLAGHACLHADRHANPVSS
jgi:hypothetical protein